MKTVYLILCVVGTVLPMSQFVPWVYMSGLDVPLFIDLALANQISAFAWLDIFVSALVVLSFILWEGKRVEMKKLWIPLVGLFTVGVSLGLPLFLLLREIHLSENRKYV